MKNLLLPLFLVSLTSVTFASNEGNVYSAPIVKRLGIHEPPPMTLDRFSGQHHERDIANFLLEQYGRHRHMTESLAIFYLSHPKTSLAYASMCVSNLNALVESKAWVKLSKSNRAILNASDRKLFKDRLIRDFDLCSSLISRFLGNRASSSYAEPITLPVATASSSSSAIRPKKKNWSFVELQSGVDFDADAQRQQEYEQQIAARQAYSRQRDDAQFQLQEAERQRWFAEQQRIQAEQSARDNRIPSFQGGLDSQAEISRQQEMWAEQQKRDAEMRAHQFP